MTEVQIIKLVVGLVAGIWPLVVGFRSKQLILGFVGFALSLAGGLAAGFILAAPVAVGCGWFIERKGSKSPDVMNADIATEENNTEKSE